MIEFDMFCTYYQPNVPRVSPHPYTGVTSTLWKSQKVVSEEDPL